MHMPDYQIVLIILGSVSSVVGALFYIIAKGIKRDSAKSKAKRIHGSIDQWRNYMED